MVKLPLIVKSLPTGNRKNAKNKTKSKPEFGTSINLGNIDVSNFNIDKKILEFAKKSFRIDNVEKFILQNIAKDGPQNEKQIYKNDLQRDSVRHRLNSRNNNRNGMIARSFLIKKHGEQIGNIPDTHENIYHLTLKGFLASLTETKFDDNYLVKKYEQYLSTQTSDPILAKFALLLIKYDVMLFLFDTVLNAVNLAALDDVHSKIYQMNQGALVDPTISHRIRDPIHADLLSTIRFWFHVYSQIFNKMIEKAKNDKLVKISESTDESEDDKQDSVSFVGSILPMLIKSWYYYMPNLQYGNLYASDPEPGMPVSSIQDVRFMGIDTRSVNLMAKQILEKYNIRSAFSRDDSPKFF